MQVGAPVRRGPDSVSRQPDEPATNRRGSGTLIPKSNSAARAIIRGGTPWLVVGAVVLGGTATAPGALAGTPQGRITDTTDTRPVSRSLPLERDSSTRRSLPRTGTETFSLLGLAWRDSPHTFEGTAQIRTRNAETGTWTEWQDLEFDVRPPESAEGREAGERGASEPLWVGPSDGVEARIRMNGPDIPTPDGLRLVMIAPGTTGQKGTRPASGAPRGDGPGGVVPAIVSRADWGADESIVVDPPTYLGKVDAVFVHHTAGTNDYTCTESSAIIRGILTYHVQTNGWNDVGYNFFVDKCGTVFEGRAGGIDQPVLGAHTYGFNSYTSGISVLGNYEAGAMPTPAVEQAVADVAAWKLGQHAIAPEGQVTLTAAGDTGVWNKGDKATLHRISGHRDGYNTLCPGATLYAALPTIRTVAGQSAYAAR